MMQTPNYKLNKPEMSDTFSTAPLSENMDKVEGALDALDARTVRLENCRIVVGRYWGNSGEQIINLGERPLAVIASHYMTHLGFTGLAVGSMVCAGNKGPALKIVDNGFWVGDILNVEHKETNGYIAILGNWTVQDIPKG